MNTIIGRFNVRFKLFLIGGISFAGCIAILILSLLFLEQNLMDDRKEKTQHLVQSAESLVNHYHSLELSGKFTKDEAQA